MELNSFEYAYHLHYYNHNFPMWSVLGSSTTRLLILYGTSAGFLSGLTDSIDSAGL